MDQTTQIIQSINSLLWGMYGLIPLLVGTGLYFTFKLRFVQIKRFVMAVKHVFGGITLFGRKADKDGMSSFQSLATAISAQVGTGNLAGVATAIAMGGPGAIFWMWIAAFFGMATIFSEAVLAQLYRTRDAHGHLTGGPAYYISQGLGSKTLAAFFSVAIIIALGFVGNMVQANSIAGAFYTAFNVPTWVTGIFTFIIAGFIFIGGIRRIASFAEKMVPIMALIYVIGSLTIIFTNLEGVMHALEMIFVGAFDPMAATGGVIGAGIKEAIRYGVARGLFSNEAGMGAVPNAAAPADATHPAKQGLVQALGVYFDTLVVCTASAMLVLLTPGWADSGKTGIELIQQTLTGQLGTWTNAFMSVTVLFFAFSSIIGNYFYGEINMDFISRHPAALWIYRAFVVMMVYLGSVASLGLVWNLADLFMALMAIVNLVAIAILGKYAFIALDDYVSQKKRGILNPEFDPSVMPNHRGILCWPRHKEEEIEQC